MVARAGTGARVVGAGGEGDADVDADADTEADGDPLACVLLELIGADGDATVELAAVADDTDDSAGTDADRADG